MTTRPAEPATTAPRGRGIRGAFARLQQAANEPLSTRAAIAIAGTAGLISAIVLLRAYRGLIFFYDEWDFIQGRRGWNVDAFLAAHNEHLALVPALVFKILFVTAGISSYWPYAVVLVLTHLAAAAALFAVIRSWSSNEAAVLGTVIMLFLGTGWEVLLWPFEMAITISLAAGLGAILALQRTSRRGDMAACGLLVVSLASASLGIPLVVGALAMMVGRAGWVRRLYVVAVPAVLWGAWYLNYGHSTAKSENIPQIPVFVADSGAASFAAVFGMNPEIGRSIMIAAAVATVAALVANRADPYRISLVLSAAGVMWALLCLSRFGVQPPSTPRYVYPGAVFMLLLLAALLGGARITTPRARVIGLVLVTLSLLTNINGIRSGGDLWRGYSAQVGASLGVMTEVRDHVPADFQPAPVYGPQIRAATYFAAAADLGSPAWDADRIATAPAAARAAADDVLRRVGALTMAVAPAAPAGDRRPQGIRVSGGTLRASARPGCSVAAPGSGPAMAVVLAVPASGLQVSSAGGAGAAPVGVRVARFGDLQPGDPMATVPPDGSILRVTPQWVATTSWRLQATSTGPIVICAVA